MNYNEIMVAQAKSRVLRELGVKTEPGKVLLKETTASYGVVTEYIGLAVGKTYNVSFLGGTFQAVCKAGEEIRYIGNLSLLIEDAENTGEAFCIAEVVEDGENGTVWSFSVEGEEFTVSTAETIHPINPKFLPGVCLPVVELETALTVEGAELSAADVAKVEALDGSAFIVKCILDFGGAHMNVTAVCGALVIDDTLSYGGALGTIQIAIANQGGSWTARFVAP